jgi:hypothetical protein
LGVQEELERVLLSELGGYDEAAFLADPRWFDHQARLNRPHEVETRVAITLMKTQPMTQVGTVAIRQYLQDMTNRGYQWSYLGQLQTFLM